MFTLKAASAVGPGRCDVVRAPTDGGPHEALRNGDRLHECRGAATQHMQAAASERDAPVNAVDNSEAVAPQPLESTARCKPLSKRPHTGGGVTTRGARLGVDGRDPSNRGIARVNRH